MHLEVQVVREGYEDVRGKPKLCNFWVGEERVRKNLLKEIPELIDAVVGRVTEGCKKTVPDRDGQMRRRVNSKPGLKRRCFMNIRGWKEFFKWKNGAGAGGISEERAEGGLGARRPRANNLLTHGQRTIRMDSGDKRHGAKSQ